VHLNAVAADDHQLAAKVALRAKLQNDNQQCTERHTHNFAFAPLFYFIIDSTRDKTRGKEKKSLFCCSSSYRRIFPSYLNTVLDRMDKERRGDLQVRVKTTTCFSTDVIFKKTHPKL
jgi:hypothetical protein